MNDNSLEQFINKNSSRAQKYYEILEEMLKSGRYIYAEHTLADILEYIDENDTITDGQIEAIQNIREKPSEGYGR